MAIHVDSIYPWYDIMRMAIPPSDFLPLNPQPQFNHEKNIRQILLGGLPGKKKKNSIQQNCQGHKKHGKAEKLSQSGRD